MIASLENFMKITMKMIEKKKFQPQNNEKSLNIFIKWLANKLELSNN